MTIAPGQKRIISWALYDCANSAFATTVMAGLFPVFFKQFWASGLDASASTYRLGQANSIAAIVGGCVAPFLGYLADRKSARKRLLFLFAAAGIVTTGALSLVPHGDWGLAPGSGLGQDAPVLWSLWRNNQLQRG